MEEKPVIRIDDNFLAVEIQRMLATSEIYIDEKVIRLVMQHQQHYLENLGIIRIVYRHDL